MQALRAARPAGTPCRRRTRPAGGKVKPSLAHSRREELVRDLNEDAGAVAGLRIAAARAAMRQVDQDLDALGDDVVRVLPLILAMKPIPQASCSLRGSYSPCSTGRPLLVTS